MKYQERVQTFDAVQYDGTAQSAADMSTFLGASQFTYSDSHAPAVFVVSGQNVSVNQSQFVISKDGVFQVLDGDAFNQQYCVAQVQS